jgi:hypothetical protein
MDLKMRLAKIKTDDGVLYVPPDKIAILYNKVGDSRVLIIGPEDLYSELETPLEEAVAEINEALNYQPLPFVVSPEFEKEIMDKAEALKTSIDFPIVNVVNTTCPVETTCEPPGHCKGEDK